MRLEVPASGPLFEGHFPGRPILPAVGLLDLAMRALATAGAAPPTLRGIERLRLRRLVAPGAVLDLEAGAPAPDGRTRIEVRAAVEVVAQGVLLVGEPAAGTHAGPVVRWPEPVSGLPPIDDLLPHRPPMRMVEWVGSATDDVIECAVRVPEGSPFDAGGTAPGFVALEMAAQAAAVGEALRRFRRVGEAGARIGYLVGVRDARFDRARLPAGEPLLAKVRLTGVALPLSTYSFEVAREGGVAASGTLSTWLTATGA